MGNKVSWLKLENEIRSVLREEMTDADKLEMVIYENGELSQADIVATYRSWGYCVDRRALPTIWESNIPLPTVKCRRANMGTSVASSEVE